MSKTKAISEATSEEQYQEVFAFYLDENLPVRFQFAHAAFFEANLWQRLRKLAESWGGNLWLSFKHRVGFKPGLVGQRWVVAGTRNQETSLSFLVKDERYQLVRANFYQAQGSAWEIDWYPRPKVFHLPRYLGFFWRVWRQNPGHFRQVFHILGHGVGMLENHRSVLKKYRPEVIVLSNDHLPWFRALTIAARELAIPTVYLQHACVADNFPPLRNDLSLLEGEDALIKYQAGGKSITGKVALVGMPKYEQYREKRNASTSLHRLGIPYNLTDNLPRIAQTVAAIQAALPEVEITLRKHPRDLRPYPEELGKSVRWSDAQQEPALRFLQHQDVIISGESSIHLEAALMNVSSIYYSFQSGEYPVTDHYGFIANGLITEAKGEEALLKQLAAYEVQRPVPADKLGYYVAATPGQSSEQRVCMEIETLLRDKMKE